MNRNVKMLRLSLTDKYFICTLLVWISTSGFISLVQSADTYPSNEYEYSVRRDWMLEAEQKFGHQNSQVLSQDEEIVDHYLQYLKWREHEATRTSGFPPSRPIEEKLAQIQKTEIYAALKNLPKGGMMHSHENHQLSKSILYDIVWESEDFQYLYLGNPNLENGNGTNINETFGNETNGNGTNGNGTNGNGTNGTETKAWMLEFFARPPENNEDPVIWLRADESGYSKEEILSHNTLLGRLSFNETRYPTDSGMRWRTIDPLWDSMAGNLINNIKIKEKYLQAMYEYGLDEGVQYFETRKNFGPFERLFTLDPESNAPDGKVYLGATWQESSNMDVELTARLEKNMTELNENFIGHKRISYTYRRNTMEQWRLEMENVARLYNTYPNNVVGFDTVGEEDAGYAHLHYLENFLMLYESTTGQSRVPLFLHLVETNWPEDLISSNDPDDPVATLNNAYEVLLLQAKRLGHATGLIKHPYLLDLVRQRNLGIEICAVSNQILGFTPDLRNHPAIHYYRSGIPIMFGPDDPGTFGYDSFTVDWYEAYMAWGIGLADLKQIALNSLNYSAMTAEEKEAAIEGKWRPAWNSYIQDMKEEACGRNITEIGEAEGRYPSFARLLPREGSRTAGTRVHIFGRNFERAICKESSIRCRFGTTLESISASYISNEHIICVTPDSGMLPGSSLPVNVSVTLDGENFISTNFTFTFKHDVLTTTVAPSGEISKSSRNYNLTTYLLLIPVLLAAFRK